MRKHRSKGITLIELMIVVVIVAVLASIAYPSYRQYSIRANRTEAKVALMQLSQALEKCYTRIHHYAECSDGDDVNDVNLVQTTPGEHYATSADADEMPTATTYKLQAVPQGGQAEDKCGTLTITHRGQRGQADGVTEKECW